MNCEERLGLPPPSNPPLTGSAAVSDQSLIGRGYLSRCICNWYRAGSRSSCKWEREKANKRRGGCARLEFFAVTLSREHGRGGRSWRLGVLAPRALKRVAVALLLPHSRNLLPECFVIGSAHAIDEIIRGNAGRHCSTPWKAG